MVSYRKMGRFPFKKLVLKIGGQHTLNSQILVTNQSLWAE